MKRLFGVILLASFFTPPAQSADKALDKNEVLKHIVSIHNKVFGVDDLYKSPIDFTPWKALMTEVGTFIDSTAKQDNVILLALRTLMEQSSDLELTIDAVRKSRGMKREVLESYLKTFDQVSQKSKSVETDLQKAKFVLATKKDAQETLSKLSMFIDQTAITAKRHLTKRTSVAPSKALPKKPGQKT